MKGLASFVMRGRFQALLVTLVGAGSLMFCWISASVLALVTLRKGAGEGAWLLLWALLPAGTLVYVYGDSGPLSLLVSAMVLALVLRGTVSLPLAVLAAVPVGVVTGLVLLGLAGGYLDQIAAQFGEFLAALEKQLSQGGGEVVLSRPTPVLIAGMLGVGTAASSVLCLLLARYWQAALYNPGGFGEEFRALYYPPAVASVLALGALGLVGLGVEYRTWAAICALPLGFAGLALVHAWAAWRRRGRGWLAGFYLAWLVLDPVKLVVMVAAVVDSWLRIRQRWTGRTGTGVDRREGGDE